MHMPCTCCTVRERWSAKTSSVPLAVGDRRWGTRAPPTGTLPLAQLMPHTALAGGSGRTLLAECPGALLPGACVLRLVCREFQAAVAAHPWEDRDTVILGSIGGWRACFPRARCANVRMSGHGNAVERRTPVVDADFVHFVGLRELSMSGCAQRSTDAAFAHLPGIRVLDMNACDQSTITDAGLAQPGGHPEAVQFGTAGRPTSRTPHLHPCMAFACPSCCTASKSLKNTAPLTFLSPLPSPLLSHTAPAARPSAPGTCARPASSPPQSSFCTLYAAALACLRDAAAAAVTPLPTGKGQRAVRRDAKELAMQSALRAAYAVL